MKKLMAILLATFSIAATAKETITLAYSWTAADAAANFYRALAQEANQMQNQYLFIFEAKPGAGGTIAAKFTESNPTNTLWLNSSAGYIRSNLFPADSQNMTDFRLIMPMCEAPVVIISNKYKNWKEVPRDKKITIGMTGMGTTTHLISLQLAKNFSNLDIIPFKSTSEILINVLNGTLDFGVGFFGDSEQYTQPTSPKKIYWLGQTGRESTKGTELLSNQGFGRDLLDMSPTHQIFSSQKMSQERRQQLRNILVQASQSKLVRDAMMADNCISKSAMPADKIEPWFNFQMSEWKRLTQDVKIER
jgi:tripartite-type tricarboxylate transporter receptor subunit TctC